jgi:tRNA(Ile)-lysidine synthase
MHAPRSPRLRRARERFAAALAPFSKAFRRGLLVAASGGPDSTALVRLLDLWRRRPASGGAVPEIHLGHVHHGIRGAEADGDAEFVRALAERYGFGFLLERVDVPDLAREQRLSIEVAARRERYRILERWARERELGVVLLGHHADDQRETVLLNLLRGAGLRGLAGMPRSRPLGRGPGPRPRVLRPLLDWERSEILDLLEALGQDFRVDSTNALPTNPRNAIREHVLPLLESEVHPGARRALTRLSRQASRLARDWNALGSRLERRRRIAGAPPRTREYRRREIRRLPPSLRYALIDAGLRSLAAEIGCTPPPYHGSHAREVEKALRSRRRHRVRLGGEGAFAIAVDGDRVVMAALAEDEEPAELLAAPGEAAALAVPGEARWRGWCFRTERIAGAGAPPGGEAPFCEVIDEDSLEGPLVVRARSPGDRFHPLGAPGGKKLKEFLRASRVPLRERASWPIVVSGPKVVWVVGRRLDHRFRVRESTRNRVKLVALPPAAASPPKKAP